MPTLSVVIPCYNQGSYLAEAVASVDAQTFRDWEIVIVDDGSTDAETRRVLDQFSHPRARILRSENRGLAGARNLGISHATGRYILPLDCDDRIAPSYLSQAVNLLEANPALGIVYCRAEFFGSQSGPWLLPPFRLPEFIFEPAIFCSAVFRRSDWEIAGGYSTDMKSGYEDHDLWLALVKRGRLVHQIPETLFFYRRTPRSMAQSLTLDQQVASFAAMFRHHRDFFIAHFETLIRGFLARESLAQLHHTRPVLQVFWPDPAGHSEVSSSRTEYAAGEWISIRIPVQTFGDSPVPLRIDPGMQPGCYDLAELQWLGLAGCVGSRVSLDDTKVEVTGTALPLPAAGFVRLLSFGSDPQVLMSGVPVPAEATILELRLRFRPHLADASDSLNLLAQRLRAT